MVITVQQILSGTRMLLRRPSELVLPDQDMRELLNDLTSGWIQDLNLNFKEPRTEIKEVTITESDNDFILTLADVEDYEAVRLEYAFVASSVKAWVKVDLVPSNAFASQFTDLGVVASLYGSDHVAGGTRIKLNLIPEDVTKRLWRLTYRTPLLAVLQMNTPIPLPSNFSRMIKLRLALACIPTMKDDSPEWQNWMAKYVPMYATELLEWENSSGEGRWDLYLSRSLENPIQPYRRYDSFRNSVLGRTVRGFLPTA